MFTLNENRERLAGRIALISLLWLLPRTVSADDLFAIRFASTDSIGTDLISINPETGEGTVVGAVRLLGFPFGLSDRGSDLFTYFPDDPNFVDSLIQIDPANGGIIEGFDPSIPDSLGGDFASLREGSLAFRGDGVGFLTISDEPGGSLWRFDLGAPSASAVTTTLRPAIDGLDFDGSDELFGLSQPLLGATYTVHLIDQTTGVSTQVGDTGVVSANENSVAGLTFTSDGTVFAVLNDALYTLDPGANYAAEFVGDIGFSRISGLAALVPEPATIVLVALGCLTLLRCRRSTQRRSV